MDRAALYAGAVQRRKAFALPGYTTLTEAGFDGPWVSPIQQSSGNLEGPMLISKDWLDAPSARAHRESLHGRGYLPQIPFNKVIDRALSLIGLTRADIYITPVFALLTDRRSSVIPMAAKCASFEAVGRHELLGRRPVAAGFDAQSVLRKMNVPHIPCPHPSARGQSFANRARRIADALEAA